MSDKNIQVLDESRREWKVEGYMEKEREHRPGKGKAEAGIERRKGEVEEKAEYRIVVHLKEKKL